MAILPSSDRTCPDRTTGLRASTVPPILAPAPDTLPASWEIQCYVCFLMTHGPRTGIQLAAKDTAISHGLCPTCADAITAQHHAARAGRTQEMH